MARYAGVMRSVSNEIVRILLALPDKKCNKNRVYSATLTRFSVWRNLKVKARSGRGQNSNCLEVNTDGAELARQAGRDIGRQWV